jgi:hypothetical protein
MQTHPNKGEKMMGQQTGTAEAGSALRRMILVLAVAALMTIMAVAMSGPASAAGNGFAKGKGDQTVSTNPGNFVNDKNGDLQNDHCLNQGNCSGSDNNGGGVFNN